MIIKYYGGVGPLLVPDIDFSLRVTLGTVMYLNRLEKSMGHLVFLRFQSVHTNPDGL